MAQSIDIAPPHPVKTTEATNAALTLFQHYQDIRKISEKICSAYSAEDQQAQSMPDASPLKWHLAHTTWAFETFLLKPYLKTYKPFNTEFEYLFNSYYNAIGNQYPRAKRGLLTKPNLVEVLAYRNHVDEAMENLLSTFEIEKEKEKKSQLQLVELLINHEQQHQELMFTDIKHLLSNNPLSWKNKKFGGTIEDNINDQKQQTYFEIEAGLYDIGHQDETFYFDNEGPTHQSYLASYKIASALVTNKEFLTFIEDGGYQKPEFWLSEAWYQISKENTEHPLYWRKKENQWVEFQSNGETPLSMEQPVKHINYFEACAFANWAGKRLPTEQEWEVAAKRIKTGFFNQLWQWTSSAYNAYPGFKPVAGAIGEYNGKFMVNQYVLRGGSVATPEGHIRPSYRNFFYPGASWQFSGIRLAETI